MSEEDDNFDSAVARVARLESRIKILEEAIISFSLLELGYEGKNDEVVDMFLDENSFTKGE